MRHRELLATFSLPLEFAPTGNNVHQGVRAGLKRKCYESMLAQAKTQGLRVGEPLPVGCLIRCTRHSTTQPDSVDGNKIPIDRLLPTRYRVLSEKQRAYVGLGLIADDSPAYVTRVDRWRRAKQKQGCFVLEIFGPAAMTRTEQMRELDARVIECSDEQRLRLLDELAE